MRGVYFKRNFFFFVKPNTAKRQLISAAELTNAFKIINHHQSFSSIDCTTKLNALMYPDSEIAAKQSVCRTKATALIKNVLAPHSVANFVDILIKMCLLWNFNGRQQPQSRKNVSIACSLFHGKRRFTSKIIKTHKFT